MQNLNVPNLLTLFRIFLIPVFVVFYYLPVTWSHIAAVIIFVVAAITDWLDGYFARNLQQGTKFGSFLDPVADKLMVAVALVLVVGTLGSPYIAIPAAIIVGREIVISGLREWMAEIGKRTSVSVTQISKLKTVLQMFALVLLLLYTKNSHWLIKWGGWGLLYAAALLTLWSMIMYLKAAWSDLTLSTNK